MSSMGAAPSISALSKSFESAEQTISASTALVVAHGLGEKPKLVELRMICKTVDRGYAVGDVILFDVSPTSLSANNGLSVLADATNITLIQMNDFVIVHRSSFSPLTINLARFKWIILAFA